jgi:serine/threonine-protein kinase
MGILDRFRIKHAIEVLLSSPDTASVERTQALARLKQIGRPAVPKLIQALGRSSGAGVLTELLTKLLDNVSLPLFCQGLAHSDRRVVSGVVEVLSRGNRYDPNRLLDLFSDPQIPKAELVKVLTAHKEALQPKALLNLLNTVGKGSRSAVFQLVDRVASESMVPVLIPYTQHQDWLVRLHIAKTLSRFSTEAVRDALMRLLNDPHKNVRQVALEGLASLQIPVEVGPLCQLLRDADLTVQSKAIEAIIQINDPQAIHHLLDILQDESEYVRRAAVEVLNALGNTNAIKDLLGALRDKDWWVRVRAADALGNIGGPRVVEAILPLIKDEDEFIRRCAVEVLNTTKDERAFHYLVEALADEDWWVRERAVDALASLGDTRAVPALLRLLEEDTETTPAAIRALVSLGDPQVIRPFLAKLHSHDKAVRKEILRGLASLTNAAYAEDVRNAIVQAMPTFDVETRELAQETLHAIASRFGGRIGVMDDAFSPAATVVQQRTAVQVKTRPHRANSLLQGDDEDSATLVDTPPETRLTDQFIDAMGLEPGMVLADRYRVVRHVGRGAFGVVVLVEDEAVHEEIILKFLNPHLAANDQIIKRFIHELRYARRITHENVIRIYDFVTLGKSFAISMEYFPSHPLASEIQGGGTFASHHQRWLRIIHAVCCGMSVAHHEAIVHRDLKPQNILVNDDGLVKIVDFGLAAAVSHTDSRLTGSGVLVGTPTYMAPEQVRGGNIDVRTDIYSLGVIMYEMFVGRPPYQGQDPISILYQHVEGKVTPPRDINPDISPTLEEIILTAMAVEPTKRYQSVNVLREQLEPLLG